jgi:putative ABC transport system substrate-binding protein
MRRREFITLIGGAAAWPLAARAQQTMPVLGFLGALSPEGFNEPMRGFRQGLRESGFIEAENLRIEYRWAENQIDRLPALAADLVSRRVAAIATVGGPPSIRAAKAATATIPVVFITGDDPIRLGYVTNLARPEGNLTGVSFFNAELAAKCVALLRELVPAAARVAVLLNPAYSPEATLKDLEQPARAMGMQLQVLNAGNERDFDTVFASLARLRAGGLVAGAHAFFNSRSEQLAALALRHSVPMISPYREFAATGGLMSYGHNINEQYRQAGVYVGRILKGEKPSDLPVQQATKVELIINLRTAKALGLTVPETLLARADEVIE